MRPRLFAGLRFCLYVPAFAVAVYGTVLSNNAWAAAKIVAPSVDRHTRNIETWFNTFLEDVTELQTFDDRLKKASTATEKLGYSLGLAQQQLRLKNGAAARDLLIKAKAHVGQTGVPVILNQIHALLLGQAYEQLERFDLAVQTLRPLTDDLQKNVDLKRFILSAYVRSLIGAKLIAEANGFLSGYSGFVSREFSDFELDFERLEISKTQFDLGLKDEAFNTWMDLARSFPITRESRAAVKLLNQHFCDRFRFEALWPTLEASRKQGRDILYFMGGVPDMRQFVFALANFDETQPVPKTKPKDLAANDLRDLLETLDFLVSAREYPLALELVTYLRKVYTSQNIMNIASQFDRFLFLEGRTFNSSQQPNQAARSYKVLFSQFPKSRYAEQGRARYSYSLHFNKSYQEASRSFLTMPGNAKRKLINMWNAMWSSYLANDAATAGPLLQKFTEKKRLDPEALASAMYWKARLDEKGQRNDDAKTILNTLATAQHSSFYSILARWRLEQAGAPATNASNANQNTANKSVQVVQVPPLNNTASTVDFNFLKHHNPLENTLDKYKTTELLVNFGLVEYANSAVEQPASFIADENEARFAGNIAARSLNFKVTSLVPRRSIWVLRNVPNTDDELKREFSQNASTWKLSFPLAYGPYVKKVGQAMGVDPFLILSLMRAESNYDADAESPVGALGLLQIMPQSGMKIATALKLQNFEPRSLLKPNYNIYFSGWYISRLVKHYKGNIALAVASYNAGPHAVDRWIKQTPNLPLDEFLENIPFKETKTYVSRVLLYLDVYKRLYGTNPGFGLVGPASFNLPQPLIENDLF